jgi:hypothetical protein
MSSLNRLLLPLAVSLTLGLAPFRPEPHVVEKLRWLVEGHPFRPVDGFDLFMHGAPWIWLIVATVLVVRDRLRA